MGITQVQALEEKVSQAKKTMEELLGDILKGVTW